MTLVQYSAEGVPLKDQKYSQIQELQPGSPGVLESTTVNISPEPQDHVVWSLANFFYANFCCLGLAALICSIKARDKKRRGDLAAARQHGSKAFIINTVIAVLICVFIITSIVVYFYNPMYSYAVAGYLVRKL